MNRLERPFFVMLLSILIFASCQDPETTEVSPEFAIPLINSSLSIQDILSRANTGDVIQHNFLSYKFLYK